MPEHGRHQLLFLPPGGGGGAENFFKQIFFIPFEKILNLAQ
jgi:hypothetical protein